MLFLTGACGLIYEVAWMRSFSLVFGSTVYATSMVIAVFMAGLAIGGFYFGRLIDRKYNPLKAFAFLQAGTALSALLVQFLFPSMGVIYAGIFKYFRDWAPVALMLRVLLSFILLIIPTVFIGAALPVISKLSVKSMKELGLRVGRLYSINTLGAVAGCLLAGFFLIAAVGVKTSVWIAAAVNILVAVIAFKTSGVTAVEPEERESEVHKAEAKGEPQPGYLPVIVLACFAVSGFASLAYEVVWFRILIMIFRNDVYAFSTMLATMLFGLALGSYISSGYVDRVKDRLLMYGALEALIGLAAVASVPLYFKLNSIMGISPVNFTGPSGLLVIRQFLVSVLILIVPATLIGGVFPVVGRIYTQKMKVGGGIGEILFINTIGSVAGSFAASFLLIPVMGVWKSLIAVALLNVTAGGILFLVNTSLDRKVKGILQGCAVLVCLAMTGYIFADGVFAVKKDLNRKGGSVIYSKEGVAGTVMVIRKDGGRKLQINRILALDTTSGSMQTVRLLGHLPMLLHPGPERVLVIGFGMGVTTWSVSRYDAGEIDCIEIIPGVKEAAEYFRDVNNNVLDDPRVKLIIGDGRSHILTVDRKYDVITCDPIHPGLGSVNLYTRECYELYKSRLSGEGVVVQFLPLHDLSLDDFKMVVNTFRSVFPHMTVWFTHLPQLIMAGTQDELKVNLQALRDKMEDAEVVKDLRLCGLENPYEMISCLLLDEAAVGRLLKGYSGINTDDRPYLDFSAPEEYSVNTYIRNLEEVLKYRPREIFGSITGTGGAEAETSIKLKLAGYYKAKGHIIKGRLYNLKGMLREEIDQYNEAVKASSINSEAKLLFRETYNRLRKR